MKLVDADALKDALFQKHVHDGEELEPMLYLEDAMKVVNEASTIDAIPVGWLRSQLKNNPNDIESAYDDICINEFIDRWQKEQEAR